jgi:acyl carrier protein
VPPDRQPSPETIDRLKVILRDDLRFADAMDIDAGSPLAGSAVELDSLDILLLVSSIEKAFSLKIPNDQIEHGAFESIETLAQFVEAKKHRAVDGAEFDVR